MSSIWTVRLRSCPQCGPSVLILHWWTWKFAILSSPTGSNSRALSIPVTALYEKDVVELCHLLGQGLDLTWLNSDGGHTSTLLALAIFRDNDTDAYAYQTSKDLRFPGLGQLDAPTLTSSSWPNILPPKQQPTMLELAVELGNSNLVQLLLDADATVNPEVGVVPPLMMAVLHRHRGNVQSLLNARADPWQAVPVVLFVTTLVLVRIPVTTPNQSISCKYPLPRAQWIRWRIYFPQAEMLRVIEQQKGPCTYSHDLTAMTERATLSWTI